MSTTKKKTSTPEKGHAAKTAPPVKSRSASRTKTIVSPETPSVAPKEKVPASSKGKGAAKSETPVATPEVSPATIPSQPAPVDSTPGLKSVVSGPVAATSAIPIEAVKELAASVPAAPSPVPVKAAKVGAPEVRIIQMKVPLIVRDLATQMGIKPFQIISDLMQLKILATVNQQIEPDVARKICEKHGARLEIERKEPVAKIVHITPAQAAQAAKPVEPRKMLLRPPVVTIMGHVDHGKTSLLDAIRKADVAGGEAGGITQHIGAHTVSLPPADKTDKNALPRTITFLDTPGHAAFTAMRARGANVTDIVVLVVAGSEGLMPQTLEAISHARAASVPIIVALTKMDLEAAQKNRDRVKKQLQEQDLASEDWGGKTITVEVSATKKTGLDHLLEMILLQAEVMELKADHDMPAEGSVIESQMEAGRGPTATVLVRRGTLRVGAAIVVEPHYGKVKALLDDHGRMVKSAGPSIPVKIVGLSGVPQAGTTFRVVASDVEARAASERCHENNRASKLEGPKRLTLEDLISNTSDNRKTLKIILKTDVHGSCEAIVGALVKLPQDKINVDVIHAAVGPVTESDVLLAVASKALIFGFQVKVEVSAAEEAKHQGIPIQHFRIIYELIDKVREMMAGLLDPEIRQVTVGSAEVKQVFPISKGGNVAGCLVSQGRMDRKGRVRVLRRRNVIFEGTIGALRRFQDDVSEVRTGLECGIRVENFDDYETGDVIEVFHLEKIAQKL